MDYTTFLRTTTFGLYGLMLIGIQVTTSVLTYNDASLYYAFFVGTALIAICFSLWAYTSASTIAIRSSTAIFGLLLAWLWLAGNTQAWPHHYWWTLAMGLCHLTILGTLLGKGGWRAQRLVFYACVASCAVQLVAAYLQMLGVIPNSNPNFRIGGLLGNPNVLALSLATVLVYAAGLMMLEPQLGKADKVVAAAYIGLCTPIIAMLQCRTAWLLCLVGIALLLGYHHRGRLRKLPKVWLGTGTLGLLVLAALAGKWLYHYKEASATSRLAIWHNTVEMIARKPWTGYGAGSFERDYNLAQASRFYALAPQERDYASGGFAEMAFNDYLEMAFQGGLPALLLYALLLGAPLWQLARQLRKGSEQVAPAAIVAAGVLIAFAAASLFNYMVIVPFLALVLVLMLAILSVHSPPLFGFRLGRLGVGLVVLGAMAFMVPTGKRAASSYHVKQMTRAKVEDIARAKTRLYEECMLLACARSLYAGANLMHKVKDTERALRLLNEAKRHAAQPELYIASANLQTSLGRYPEAATDYQTALGIQPYKLAARYGLMMAYHWQDMQAQALEQARIILAVQARGNAEKAQQIKTAAQQYIEELYTEQAGIAGK